MKYNNLYIIAGKLLSYIPDWFTGKTSVMQLKYRARYGQRDCNSLIHQRKIKTLVSYILICIISLIGIIFTILGQLSTSEKLMEIERPEHGQSIKSMPVQVSIKFGNTKIIKNVDLRVRQKQLSNVDKKNALQSYKPELDIIILGDNKDINHVLKPLNLMERDTLNGITIVWSSNKPEIINEEGEVDLLKADKGEVVKLSAIVSLDDYTETWSYYVRLSPSINESDYEGTLNIRLEKIIDFLNKSTGYKRIKLPNSLGDNIYIEWTEVEEDNATLLILAFIIAMSIIYFKRYDQIDKEIRYTTDSIIHDLPEFINKLVLLLNAGLVVSSALSKIADDYEHYNLENAKSNDKNKRIKGRFLYEELCEIERHVKQTNTPIIKELREFSQRSGVRELVRLSTIISDNMNKGSTLSEKLEAEGELLWMSRKKRAEEKGRLAETKLTFPLVILLIVLIMVTIAPALMEM